MNEIVLEGNEYDKFIRNIQNRTVSKERQEELKEVAKRLNKARDKYGRVEMHN